MNQRPDHRLRATVFQAEFPVVFVLGEKRATRHLRLTDLLGGGDEIGPMSPMPGCKPLLPLR